MHGPGWSRDPGLGRVLAALFDLAQPHLPQAFDQNRDQKAKVQQPVGRFHSRQQPPLLRRNQIAQTHVGQNKYPQ